MRPPTVAAAVGNRTACEALFYLNDNPLLPDNQSRTPIDYANQAGHVDIVKLLEKHISK